MAEDGVSQGDDLMMPLLVPFASDCSAVFMVGVPAS